MKRVTRNGLIAVAAASGAMAVSMPVSAAFAADGATADGAAAGSPGLVAGNTIQAPVHVPVNLCGNTVNVAGVLNSVAGNSCANTPAGSGQTSGAGGTAAQADGQDSPGVGSGNTIQVPVHVPVNVSGNSANGDEVGDETVGNTSTNESGDSSDQAAPSQVAPTRTRPAPAPVSPVEPALRTQASLAHTGADWTVPAGAASAALLLGGVALHRRFRPGASR